MVSCVQKSFIIISRKLGVNGQPNGFTGFPATGKFDGKVHPLVASWASLDLFGILLLGQDLFEQRLKLGLTKNASRLHIGEDTLQIPHTFGQGLHVPKTLVDLVEPVCNLFETLRKPELQGGLQLLIHGLSHLIELGCVVELELLELMVQSGADLGHAFRIALTQRVNLCVQ